MGNQRKFPKYCVLDLFIYIVWTGISETHGQIFLVSSLSKTFRTTIIFPFAPGVFVFTRAARDLVIRPIMPTDLGLESEAYLNTWFAISNLFLFFVWILWFFEDFPHSQMLYLICFIRYTRVDGDWALVSWSIHDALSLSTSRCSILYSFRTVFTICAFSSGRSFQVSPCTSADTEGIQSVVSQLNGADIIMQWVHPPKNVAKILQVYTEVSIKARQQHFTAVDRTSNHRRLSNRASFRTWVAP